MQKVDTETWANVPAGKRMTAREMARHLGINAQSLLNMRARGSLPANITTHKGSGERTSAVLFERKRTRTKKTQEKPDMNTETKIGWRELILTNGSEQFLVQAPNQLQGWKTIPGYTGYTVLPINGKEVSPDMVDWSDWQESLEEQYAFDPVYGDPDEE